MGAVVGVVGVRSGAVVGSVDFGSWGLFPKMRGSALANDAGIVSGAMHL